MQIKTFFINFVIWTITLAIAQTIQLIAMKSKSNVMIAKVKLKDQWRDLNIVRTATYVKSAAERKKKI